MKVNPETVRKWREQRAWSQEHLAEVTGLSLRTIQRVEAEGKASNETRMALASAFGCSLAELELAAEAPVGETAPTPVPDPAARPIGRVWLVFTLVALLLLFLDWRSHQAFGWSKWPVLGLFISLLGTGIKRTFTGRYPGRSRSRGFFVHASIYALVCSGLAVMDWKSSGGISWSRWPMLGWGLGLALHGLLKILTRSGKPIRPTSAKALTAAVLAALVLFAGPLLANPNLAPGVWANISPPGLDLTTHYGTAFVQLDPSHPSTLYLTADMQGLWKSEDGGSNWSRLGKPPANANYGDTTDYLDSPVSIAVDPGDSRHLYVTQGVRGTTQGFWVTHDGGATWILPAGYVAIAKEIGTRDVTTMAIDPTDFAHVLVGSHSPWKGLSNAGILETLDGGDHWVAHAPASGFTSATMGVNFLFDPATKQGNAKTWLIGTDGEGLWRTTDGGDNFTRVTPKGVWPDFSIAHGGQSVFYAKNGTLYAGAFVYPSRSTDNGLTWTSISGDNMTYAAYYSIMGDGVNLYTLRSFADNGAKYDSPFLVSAESDGLNWTPYEGGKQKFDNGPYTMRFDPQGGILYAACWNAGLWALKVTGTAGLRETRSARKGIAQGRPFLVGPGESLRSEGMAGRDIEFFGMDGKRVADRRSLSGSLEAGGRILIARIKRTFPDP